MAIAMPRHNALCVTNANAKFQQMLVNVQEVLSMHFDNESSFDLLKDMDVESGSKGKPDFRGLLRSSCVT
jgi:hypothetical protein